MTEQPPAIPASPEAISEEWLTEVLRCGGVISEGQVTSIERSSVGDVAGFTGQVVRLKLCGDAAGLPSTVIAKLHNRDPRRRALFARLRYAARELAFYRELLARRELGAPRLYHGAVDGETGNSILLLEDLDGARSLGDDAGCCQVEDMSRVLLPLARFHAASWGPKARAIPWLPAFDLGAEKSEATFRDSWWPTFLERVASPVPDQLGEGTPLRCLGECLKDRATWLKRALVGANATFVHVDFRPDNIFLTGDSSVAVIDWENGARASGALDVAFFLLMSLSAEDRRAHEQALLRTYHATLARAGIDAYDFDTCLYEYRLGLVQSFFTIVFAVVVLDTMATPRGREVTFSAIARAAVAAEDHGLVDLLSHGDPHER